MVAHQPNTYLSARVTRRLVQIFVQETLTVRGIKSCILFIARNLYKENLSKKRVRRAGFFYKFLERVSGALVDMFGICVIATVVVVIQCRYVWFVSVTRRSAAGSVMTAKLMSTVVMTNSSAHLSSHVICCLFLHTLVLCHAASVFTVDKD